MKNQSLLIGGLIALLFLAGSSMFIVDQREKAIVFQLGEIVSVKTDPGLYFKIPMVQSVRFFDSRILTMDAEEPDR
ncbi:MAG: protease modulator HflC, partial [Betaproteobacteria bacterium]